MKTSFGRAQRLADNGTTLTAPISEGLNEDERTRYAWPQLRVILPGGPYFKRPWERVYKVSIATQTVSMAFDPEHPSAKMSGTILEVVTKDQLNTGLTGQIRYRVSERNLYGHLFGVKRPIAQVMRYFVSALRGRIAKFEAPKRDTQPGTVEAKVNRVGIIGSTAERQAAVEFAKAGAIRPRIVGAAFQKIAKDQEVFSALFDVLETQRIIAGEARVTLLPQRNPMLAELLAAGGETWRQPVPTPLDATGH